MAKIGVDRAAPIADEVPAGVFDGEDQAAIGPDVDPNEFIHVDAQVEGWTIRSRLSSLLTKIYRKLERGRISVCWLESFGMNQGNSGWWKTRSFRKLLAKLGEIVKIGYFNADCDQTDLIFYEHVRSSWICGKADPNEKDSQRPQFQLLPIAQSQNPRGRGGLPPSVAADLSSNLQ
ncbi:hypothetical protein LINPERHAP2_LOCUS36226 [Linum perenne]